MASYLRPFFSSLERYQGAQQESDPFWALIHAEEIKSYSSLMSKQLSHYTSVLSNLSASLDQDPRYEVTVNHLQFNSSQIREAKNLGLTDTQINELKSMPLGLSATTKKELLKVLANKIKIIDSLVRDHNSLSLAMVPEIENIRTDNSNFTDFKLIPTSVCRRTVPWYRRYTIIT